MDLMEKMDLDNQMMVLEGAAMEDESQNINDEVEDLSNSLKEIIQDEAAKTKLHCLMMDPDFSMVTLQSEESGILWETMSSCCSAPSSSEIGFTAPELCTSLVSQCHHETSGSETAGKIIFIMDENQVVRRNKRIRTKALTKPPTLTEDGSEEPERPAMVEVSIPNVTTENRDDVDVNYLKEDKNQRLFQLVSEGSEILNIIVPPKVSTVDEEESKALVDNLSYLEETPVIKATEISYEPETSVEDLESIIPPVPEPFDVPPITKPVRRRTTSEDYFEKFTLLDNQASGPPVDTTIEDIQEPESITEEAEETKDQGSYLKPSLDTKDDSISLSELEFTSEHLDDIFYGGGRDPDSQHMSNNDQEKDIPKSSLKKSGSALFGSQESILTPVYLPSGPEKIIDLVLLEEPKAMAFMYSDLYADAIGNRMKQDDTESLTSEKSFHSQESDIDDRGYLEKFVLKDETPQNQLDSVPDLCQEDRVQMWSKGALGLTHRGKDSTVELKDAEEVTDFLRSSANSSPCDHLDQEEPVETKQQSKARHVFFQDEATKQGIEAGKLQSTEISTGVLPLDIRTDPPALEKTWNVTDYKSVIAEFADKTAASKPSKPEKTVKVNPCKFDQFSVIVPPTVQPIRPHHKPFLDLTPLLLVPTPEEVEIKDMEGKAEEVTSTDAICSSTDQVEETSVNVQECELITKPEGNEFDSYVASESDHNINAPLS